MDSFFAIESTERKRPLAFNGLDDTSWARMSRSVWRLPGLPKRVPLKKEHGATFPDPLAAKIIQVYTGENDLVFDPFLGSASTMVAAYQLGRSCVGIELNPEFVEICKKRIWYERSNLFDSEYSAGKEWRIICDDCRNMLKHIAPGSVQLTCTSPPYADFIQKSLENRKNPGQRSIAWRCSTIRQYSEEERDFGNLSYEDFLEEITELLKTNLVVTKVGGYSVWVVRDYRDAKNGKPYINFHSAMAEAGERAGWLFHDLIVWDQNDEKSLACLGHPTIFYTNQNNSYLVVFRKSGDANGVPE